WSSDVCSSDLYFVEVFHKLQNLPKPEFLSLMGAYPLMLLRLPFLIILRQFWKLRVLKGWLPLLTHYPAFRRFRVQKLTQTDSLKLVKFYTHDCDPPQIVEPCPPYVLVFLDLRYDHLW